jgi:hypothetical protein
MMQFFRFEKVEAAEMQLKTSFLNLFLELSTVLGLIESSSIVEFCLLVGYFVY